MDEFGLIQRFFAPIAAREPGAFGLRDDAAVLDLPPGTRLVVTTDAVVAGVHFFADDPADDIARKLMRVNLSDLAAMGAAPRGVLLAGMFPENTEEEWLAAFARGIAEDCAAFDVDLVGGDTTSTPGPLSLSLTALGTVTGTALLRSGARAGDDIYVSGTIGDAALGLKALKGARLGVGEEALAPLVSRYMVPEPRIALGRALAKEGLAHACADVSDGLLADLGHIAACSQLGADIEAASVPLSPAARRLVERDRALLGDVLTGGDDYELCFTAPATAADRIAALSEKVGTRVTRIGHMMSDGEVRVVDAEAAGLALKARGYTHF